MMRQPEPTGATTDGAVPADPAGRFPPPRGTGRMAGDQGAGGAPEGGGRRLFTRGKLYLIRNNGVYLRYFR